MPTRQREAPSAAPARLGLLRTVLRDAFELSRPRAGVTAHALRSVMASDGFHILVLTRMRESVRAFRIPGINHLLRRVQTVVYGIEINNGVVLGAGVDFVHPIGIVVGGNAQVGCRVRFLGGNTVGTVSDNGYPVIEDDVVIGAGARILGPIRIGARSRVGANAVVVHDVPPDSVVVGVPGRVRTGAGAQ